jgi:hypothetical protein
MWEGAALLGRGILDKETRRKPLTLAADAAFDPGRRAPCRTAFYGGVAPSRDARESGVTLLSLWGARNPHFMRPGGL